MVFKKIRTEYSEFDDSQKSDVVKMLYNLCQSQPQVMSDLLESPASHSSKRKRRDESQSLRDIIVALTVCNNVTPVVGSNNQREFQASSPDEIALVKYAETLGFVLSHRDHRSLQFIDPCSNKKEVEILECFPFSSESKRMGILV